jgi:uncharacterized iron-regulated protein
MGPVLLSLTVTLATAALLGAGETTPSGMLSLPSSFHTGQVWDVQAGRPVDIEPWLADLASARIIYFGEEHRNPWHIEAALRVLQALTSQGRTPVLALEMFDWESQSALDRYLSDTPPSREEFLTEARWEETWGGPFEDYEPLVNFARNHHLPLVALNPPRALVRLVAKQGLARAKQDERMALWGMRDETLSDDPRYRSVVFDQIRRCHAELPDEAYQRLYEASVFRDEGMAKTIAEYLRQHPQSARMGPVVVYTGTGHMQYRLPVPNRVARRLGSNVAAHQRTIYLMAYEPSRADAIRELLREPIADYVWLTPLGPDGPPRSCR